MFPGTQRIEYAKDETSMEVQVDLSELKETLATNCEMFLNFNLAEELVFPVPEFHKESWRWLIDPLKDKVVLALPRGHAKTTLAKLSVLWHFLFTHVRFIIYVSNTAPIAKAYIRDIITFIRKDNFVKVFGKAIFEKDSDSEGIYIFILGGKRCILKSLGANQQVRGVNVDNRRPQILVIDDLEDEENTRTEASREKLSDWVYGTLFKALDATWNKILWLGNMISATCMLKQLCEDQDWHSMLLGCLLKNGEPLWADLWPLTALIKDFNRYKRAGKLAIWFAEMMNMPMTPGGGILNIDKIKYHPQRYPDDLEAGCITIDPALGREHSDNTGMVVHGLVDGNPEQVDFINRKLNPTETCLMAIELCYKWRVNVIGIENAGFQMALEDIFKLLFVQYNIENIEIVPLQYGNAKLARMVAFWSLNEAGEYAICENASEIISEAVAINPKRTDNVDDLNDALAYGPQMMDNFLGLMMQNKALAITQVVQTGRQVCPV